MRIKTEKFIAAGIFLMLVILFGTIGFYYIEGWDWIESFYATTMTITGVGAEGFMPLTPTGKIFMGFLALVSVGITIHVIFLISDPFLERWLNKIVKLEEGLEKHAGSVVKRSGEIQEFSKEKIVNSCIKAGASRENAKKVVEEVTSKFRNHMKTEEIGELVIASLRKYDKKATDSFEKFFRKR